MDVKTLLDNFATIADAPGGVQRLRDLVLELAVCGRLLEQDPSHESAIAGLERIATQRATAIGELSLRGHKPSRTPQGALKSLQIVPSGWAVVPLGDTFLVVMGNSPSGDSYNMSGAGVPLINGPVEFSPAPLGRTVIRQFTTAPTRLCKEGDLLVCVRGATTGRTNVAGFDACIGRGVALVRGWEAQPFVNLLMWNLGRHLLAAGKGTIFPSVSQDDLAALRVLIPPLAEQGRIVAKVDELMGMCDELEARQGRRHRATTRFRGSALSALTEAQTVDELRCAWERLCSHWPAITSHAHSIADLRETMVQLAVEGRLCLQDPTDEPAIDILHACRRRKASLVKAGIARSRSELEPASDGELPYQLPVGWTLARLDQWCDIAGGLAKGRKIVGRPMTALPYLRVANVKAGYLALDVVKQIEVPVDEVDRYSLQPGDVLLTEGGDWDKLGRSAIWTGEIDPCLHQNHVFRARTLAEGLRPHWVSLFTNSETGRQYFQSKAKRTTNLASINMTELRSMPLPVPPAAEQLRILTSLTMFTDGLARLQRALRGKDEAERLLAHGLTSASVEL